MYNYIFFKYINSKLDKHLCLSELKTELIYKTDLRNRIWLKLSKLRPDSLVAYNF